MTVHVVLLNALFTPPKGRGRPNFVKRHRERAQCGRTFVSKRFTETQSQREMIDAIADETTHLRAELNAIKAELQALRDACPCSRERLSFKDRRNSPVAAQRVRLG